MRALIASFVIAMFILQPVVAFDSSSQVVDLEEHWWENTSMDLDNDGIHDAIWLAIESKKHDWVDVDGRIGVIVDFDHLPTESDRILLESNVDFVHFHTYYLIHSIAGRVSVNDIVELSKLSGVVMVELDGILQVSNSASK